MGLIAPLFLLGLLAVALPIWLHRLQTKSSNRQPFSSAMLLQTTEQRVHVQKKLKYLLLLAARIAVLLLIAAAFAQPFLERDNVTVAETGAGADLIVIDTSASMARSGVFDQALTEARRAVDDAENGSVIQILSAGSSLRELRPASADKTSQRTAINNLQPGTARVDYGQLIAALESYAERLPAPVRLHLISDFQASAMPPQFADVIGSGIARLLPHVVGTGEPVNWSIRQIRETPDGIDVAISSRGLPDRSASVQLTLNGEAIESRAVTGVGQHTVSFNNLVFAAGDNSVEVAIETDDDLVSDNRGYSIVRNDPPLPVPLITLNPSGLPRTYISAALESVANSAFTVEAMTPGSFDPRVLSRYRWAIVDDIGSLDSTLAEQLSDFVDAGGNLLAFAGDASQSLQQLPVSNLPLAAVDLGSGVRPWRGIGSIDTRHAALADTDGWHLVRVSRSVAVDLDGDEDVLVRLDSGAPFIIERQLGDGRVIQVLSAADNRWNDMPVHPVFVGFMIEAADYLSGRLAEFGSYTAGETLSLAATGAGQVLDPDGEPLLSLAATAEARAIRLDKPGIYTVYTGNEESLVAANVDPRESELEVMTQQLLDRWQDATFTATTASATNTAEARADPLALWPWLLLLLAILVIAESALGNVHIATRMRATQ